RAARPVGPGKTAVRGLPLAHLPATLVHASAGHVVGLPEAPLKALTIAHLSVSFADDPRPGSLGMPDGIEHVTRDGLRLGAVRGGTISGVRVRGAEGPPVHAVDCDALSIEVAER